MKAALKKLVLGIFGGGSFYIYIIFAILIFGVYAEYKITKNQNVTLRAEKAQLQSTISGQASALGTMGQQAGRKADNEKDSKSGDAAIKCRPE